MLSPSTGVISQDRGQTISQDRGPVVSVRQMSSQDRGPIVSLRQMISEDRGPIVSLRQMISQDRGPIVSLQQMISEDRGPIVSVRQMISQDRDPIVSTRQLRDYENVIQASRSGALVNVIQLFPIRHYNVSQLLRSGAPVPTIKKFDAGSSKKTTAPVSRKLEEATEPAALEKVCKEVRHKIQKVRLEKKMSQAELAKLINETAKVVQEYENGKAVPNQGVLGKMERVLGVKLRGKVGK